MVIKSLVARLKAIIYSSYVFFKTHIVVCLRWRGRVSIDGGCRVSYGHDKIPGKGEKASGGIIKCQDLQKKFPNNRNGANLLYLVSSALPPYSGFLVRNAKKSGAKLIVNQNGVAIPAYHENTEIINKPRRFLLQQADHVVYQSEYCKVSSDKYLTTEVENYSILHNPVDVRFFLPEKNKSLSTTPILLMTGSHHFFYRVATGVELVSVLKRRGVNVKLRIYGRLAWKSSVDECYQELMTLCREQGVENMVEVGKPYRQIDAPRIYQSADIMIHTKYKDPCPRAVVEAMACGLPVIYSDSGGVPELVGSEAGIGVFAPVDWEKVHPPEPEKMADAVIAVLSTYGVYSSAARCRAEESLDVQQWLEAHRLIFETVLAQ